jgi:hypothetical protein
MEKAKPPNNGEEPKLTDVPVQKAQVLWNEYQNRHDLVWRVIFQVTTAAVILSVALYLASKELVDSLKVWLLAAPVLAVVLVGFSMLVVNHEQKILEKIRSTHRCLQTDLFKQYGLSWQDQQKLAERQQSSQSSFIQFANFFFGQ